MRLQRLPRDAFVLAQHIAALRVAEALHHLRVPDDVGEEHGPQSAECRLSRQGGLVKSFYTPHGGSLNFKQGSVEAKVFLGIERLLERYTTGLIFESAYAARVYAERVRKPTVPLRVIPNGLQPADFEPAPKVAEATDILFVGELRPIKGIDFLIAEARLCNS